MKIEEYNSRVKELERKCIDAFYKHDIAMCKTYQEELAHFEANTICDL